MSIQQRARRALARQLSYQEEKANAIRGHERDVVLTMMQASRKVRADLERVSSIDEDARVLEVGSGAHGLIFFFGARYGIGIDPLAREYASLFPVWQDKAVTMAAFGESLPFADDSFDVILCDNVVDHAESPSRIVKEIARVLSPGGLLYFTVNVHHPVYAFASQLHSAWNALGLKYEIRPFADHTVHLTHSAARQLFEYLPLGIVQETNNIDQTKAGAARTEPRHLGDKLKRVFFKNALYEVIAVKEGRAGSD
jgi:SAM-dependent methyltransferase